MNGNYQEQQHIFCFFSLTTFFFFPTLSLMYHDHTWYTYLILCITSCIPWRHCSLFIYRKDLIIRGGENVSCAEVESAFYSHPNVLECAAFGMKDERLGERVGICIVLKPSTNDATPSKNDFIKHVKDGLARFKTPLAKDMFIQKTQLDRGATGKILKRAIRDRFNAASSKL